MEQRNREIDPASSFASLSHRAPDSCVVAMPPTSKHNNFRCNKVREGTQVTTGKVEVERKFKLQNREITELRALSLAFFRRWPAEKPSNLTQPPQFFYTSIAPEEYDSVLGKRTIIVAVQLGSQNVF